MGVAVHHAEHRQTVVVGFSIGPQVDFRIDRVHHGRCRHVGRRDKPHDAPVRNGVPIVISAVCSDVFADTRGEVFADEESTRFERIPIKGMDEDLFVYRCGQHQRHACHGRRRNVAPTRLPHER